MNNQIVINLIFDPSKYIFLGRKICQMKTTCKIMMFSCSSDFRTSKLLKSEKYYFQIGYLHTMRIVKQHKSPHFHIIGVEQRTFITAISLLFLTFSYLLYFFFHGCPVQVSWTMKKSFSIFIIISCRSMI